MNKIFSIIKATRSDIAFSNKSANKKRQTTNIRSTIGYMSLIIFVFGMYAFIFASELSKVNMTYVILALFSIAAVLMSLTGGIMKAGNMIYASKDNDLLLSMPIKKSDIYFARVIKFILYEYIQTLTVMIPAIVAYSWFEKPGFMFYVINLIFVIALPILPVILSCIIGYITESVSSKMKNKSVAQTIISFIFFAALMYVSFSMSSIIEKISEYAPKIANTINGIYFPIKYYIESIATGNPLNVIYILLGSFALLVSFVMLLSINYFKVISKLSEKYASANYKLKETKTRSIVLALINKELKRYVNSSIYIINTIIFPLAIFGFGIYSLFAKIDISSMLKLQGEIPNINVILILAICTMLGTASTTACSISIEGSKIGVLKSFPIKIKNILASKVLMNLFVMLPLEILGITFLGIGLRLGIITTLVAILTISIYQVFVAVFGILVNLKFPKFDATNDTIVVKQSASVVVSIFSSMIVSGMLIVLYMSIFKSIVSGNIYLIGVSIAIAIINLALWQITKKYGEKKFIEF